LTIAAAAMPVTAAVAELTLVMVGLASADR
jgi:hypothetical protein